MRSSAPFGAGDGRLRALANRFLNGRSSQEPML